MEKAPVKYGFDDNSGISSSSQLRCTSTLPFSAIFTKGNNFFDFLFGSLDKAILPIWGELLQERICYYMSKFFPLI